MLDKMRRARLTLFAAALLLALSMAAFGAACGGDDDDSTGAEGTAGTQENEGEEGAAPGESDGDAGAGPGNNVSTVRWEEIQCLGNPWEQAWLTENAAESEEYPADERDQLRIFQNYWRDMDILVFSAATRKRDATSRH
jgi:hypothetical protein